MDNFLARVDYVRSSVNGEIKEATAATARSRRMRSQGIRYYLVRNG